MRPTLLIGISAILALATTAPLAGADNSGPPPSPPTFAVNGGNLTVSAGANAHINGDYSWSIKDSAGPDAKTLKPKSAFSFAGTQPNYASATVALVPGVLKGAYCGTSTCIPFTATCTAASCTMN